MVGSFGAGLGHAGLLIRFKPMADAETAMHKWLLEEILPPLPWRPGIGSVHLFEAALTPQMTNEQRIRGADAGLDSALLVTGYGRDALASLMQGELGSAQLEAHGATRVLGAMYRLEYSIIQREVR